MVSDLAKSFKLPGFVWVSILVVVVGGVHMFVPADAMWYDAILVLLAGLAKAVGVNFERVPEIVDEFDGETQAIGRARSYVAAPAEPSKIARWLVG